jgi:hypothetical protein
MSSIPAAANHTQIAPQSGAAGVFLAALVLGFLVFGGLDQVTGVFKWPPDAPGGLQLAWAAAAKACLILMLAAGFFAALMEIQPGGTPLGLSAHPAGARCFSVLTPPGARGGQFRPPRFFR